MRRETGFGREAVMGHEMRGKTIGIVGIGEVARGSRGCRAPSAWT
jgi:D-3-phosphoglycerate dehydrogenase